MLRPYGGGIQLIQGIRNKVSTKGFSELRIEHYFPFEYNSIFYRDSEMGRIMVPSGIATPVWWSYKSNSYCRT